MLMRVILVALALALVFSPALAQKKQKVPRGPSDHDGGALEDLKAFRDKPPVAVRPPGRGALKGDTVACTSPSAVDKWIGALVVEGLFSLAEKREVKLPVSPECATTLLKAQVLIEYRGKTGLDDFPVLCVRPLDAARCLWVSSYDVEVE